MTESVGLSGQQNMQKTTRIAPGTPGKLFDFKLGYTLLFDRRVPLLYKITAFGIGYASVAILGFLEFPVEEIIALVPFLGIVGDVAIDGLEAVYVPFLLACLMLPHLAPSTVVDVIRRERSPGASPAEGPIIDV